MTQKTNTNNEDVIEAIAGAEALVTSHISQDLRNAVLIISLILNLFIFTAWLAMQVTSRYDTQIASFLFS